MSNRLHSDPSVVITEETDEQNDTNELTEQPEETTNSDISIEGKNTVEIVNSEQDVLKLTTNSMDLVGKQQAAVDVNRLMEKSDRTPEVLAAMTKLLEAGRVVRHQSGNVQRQEEVKDEKWSDFVHKLPDKFWFTAVPLMALLIAFIAYTPNFFSFIICTSVVIAVIYGSNILEKVINKNLQKNIELVSIQADSELQVINNTITKTMIDSSETLHKDRLTVVKDIVGVQRELQIQKMTLSKEMHTNELQTQLTIKTMEEEGQTSRHVSQLENESDLARLKSQTEILLREKLNELDLEIKEIDRKIVEKVETSKINQLKMKNDTDMKLTAMNNESQQRIQATQLADDNLKRNVEFQKLAEQKRSEREALAMSLENELAKAKAQSEANINAQQQETERVRIHESGQTARYTPPREEKCVVM